MVTVPGPQALVIGGNVRTRPRAVRTRVHLHSLVARMRVTDALIILASFLTAQLIRFGWDGWGSLLHPWPATRDDWFYLVLPVTLTLVWSAALQLYGSYDRRRLGTGAEAYSSIAKSTMLTFTVMAMASYAFKLEISRLVVLVAFPLAAVLLTLSCLQWRLWLQRRRLEGLLVQRTLVVGHPGPLDRVIRTLSEQTGAGYQVVAACTNTPEAALRGVPVMGAERSAGQIARNLDVDVVVCASGELGSDGVRELGWALERTGIDLVIVPSLHEVSAQRVLSRPVSGLQLLFLESPHFTDGQLILKSLVDRILGLIILVFAAPIMAVVAILVKREDDGPVLLRQTRVGLDGKEFTMLKFRSMVPNAEGLRAAIVDEAEDAVDRGPMFKRRDDPRITHIGKILRRTSIDELPQIINVLRGEMSLVGPRPPLPREVVGYSDVARRRLLVRPGMTGLWQINGRSDLSWDDTIRYDLYYVENWSLTGDLLILFRTVRAVLQQRGAY